MTNDAARCLVGAGGTSLAVVTCRELFSGVLVTLAATGLGEPFLVRDWHFKEKIIPESMRAILLLGEGMAATLGTNLVYLLSLDRTDLQLDDDIYI